MATDDQYVLGAGVRQAMEQAGDEPITHEWTEERGPSRQAFAWGRKGLYVASADGGAWRVAGPFGVGEP